VAEMCSETQGANVSLRGCMFPGALNFDPSAKEPGHCRYFNKGCNREEAVNYNPDATLNDGSCIRRRRGCTVRNEGYFQVNPDTPGYKSRDYGSALRGVGLVPWPSYQDVINYDPDANVLDGCIVAIEGCMEEMAVNYDPAATINSNTWCIPLAFGCMMPTARWASSRYSNPSTHQRQGLATGASYDPSATVHAKELCVVEYYGCTSITAVNYDSSATVDSGDCWEPKRGCLDLAALNFGCTQPKFAPCPTLTRGRNRITIHEPRLCQFESEKPPPLPPPPVPPGFDVDIEYSVDLTYSFVTTDANFSTVEYETSMQQKLADLLSVDAEAVTVSVSELVARRRSQEATASEASTAPLSYEVHAIVLYADVSEAQAGTATVQTAMGDTWESAAAFVELAPNQLSDLPSVSTVQQVEVVSAPPPPLPPLPLLSLGAIIGLAVGACFSLSAAGAIFLLLQRRARITITFSTVAPNVARIPDK